MEKQLSITCVAAIALWVATFTFILTGTVVGLATGHDYIPVVLSLMAHGLALGAAAATVTMRQMLKSQYGLLRTAFELGQDSAGGSPPVRRLH